MILHVVLFRPKPELNADARRGLAQAFADAIDGIGSIKQSADWPSPDASADRTNN